MYSQLFARSFKWFKDFILFFFYLVLGLAFGVNALAKLSGGPLDLIYASGAVSGIMRLTFGFYDYDGEMMGGYRVWRAWKGEANLTLQYT